MKATKTAEQIAEDKAAKAAAKRAEKETEKETEGSKPADEEAPAEDKAADEGDAGVHFDAADTAAPEYPMLFTEEQAHADALEPDVVAHCRRVVEIADAIADADIPVPTAEEAAAELMEEPEALAKVREVLAIIDRMENKQKASAAVTDTKAAEVEAYKRIVKQYGKDYVHAKKGVNERYFTRKSWNNMNPDKKTGTRNGWAEVTRKMPEQG